MTYKGHTIRHTSIDLPFGGKVSGYEIVKDGKRLSYADTVETAKRYVDSRSEVRNVDERAGR